MIMKKSIFLLIMLFMMGAMFPAKAQVKLGLTAGVNISNLTLNEDVFKTTNQAGYFIGSMVKVGLPLTGFEVAASALYNRQEAKVEKVTGDIETTLKRQEIIIPIHLKYMLGLGDTANIFAFAGPQVGFAIGDKTKSLKEQAACWRLNSSNFSVNMGMGLTFARHFQLTATYNIGLGKTGEITWKTAGDRIKKNADAKSNSWRIGLAYIL